MLTYSTSVNVGNEIRSGLQLWLTQNRHGAPNGSGKI